MTIYFPSYTGAGGAKKGAPPCGVFLTVPDVPFGFGLIEKLNDVCRALNASVYEKNLHVFTYDGRHTAMTPEEIAGIAELLQAKGMVFLMHDTGAGVPANVDGVIVNSPADIRPAAQRYGEEKIIGYAFSTFEADEMTCVLQEAPDIAIFPCEGGPERIENALAAAREWSSRSEAPCVIKSAAGAVAVKELINAGVTFIDATPAEGAAIPAGEAVASLLDGIENALGVSGAIAGAA